MRTAEQIKETKRLWFQKNKTRIVARRRDYIRNWVANHKERMAHLRREWKIKNRNKKRESDQRWLEGHMDQRREYMKRYNKANMEHKMQAQRERLAKYKRLVVDAYGGCCGCCGENELVFLTLEHTLRNGKHHRIQEGKGNFYLSLINRRFPKDEGLAILCINCNWAQRNGAICPHKKAQLEIIGL